VDASRVEFAGLDDLLDLDHRDAAGGSGQRVEVLRRVAVDDVAEMVGFTDAKAFSRFYFAQKKISPSKMKKIFFLQK